MIYAFVVLYVAGAAMVIRAIAGAAYWPDRKMEKIAGTGFGLMVAGLLVYILRTTL